MTTNGETSFTMQDGRKRIFLTGATGLIGRYVLRDSLAQGHEVTVLVRPQGTATGRERIELALSELGYSVPHHSQLTVLEGELPDFVPSLADRRALSACHLVIHSAASLQFHPTSAGDPDRTNVLGTERLLDMARESGIPRWIQVSTAYVCGDAMGDVLEEIPAGYPPRNAYEASKRAAEEMVRQSPGLDWTILRPGIVVGDSRTGYTSTFQGIYPCFQAISFLARKLKADANGKKSLPIRFRITGEELTHLVPVDWVAAAILAASMHPESVGRHFHLTPRTPIAGRNLVRAVSNFFSLSGLECIGDAPLNPEDRNGFERIFERKTDKLTDYFRDDPHFNRQQLDALLPALREPVVDEAFIALLLRYAEDQEWGNLPVPKPAKRVAFDCRDFFENHFPRAAQASQLARIPDLTVKIGFEVEGPGGGVWIGTIENGEVISVVPRSETANTMTFRYRTNVETLSRIVSSEITTREAFFERSIDIEGDIERALLLSLLFEDVLRESPYPASGSPVTTVEQNCV